MPEINNALAAQIQVPQIDVAGTLGKIASIKNTQAATAQTEQETKYRQFQQDQNGGYRASEVNTLEDARKKHIDNMGQLGNILANDPSPRGVQHFLETSSNLKYPVDPRVIQILQSGNKQAIAQLGSNIQQAGQPAGTSIEQTGQPTHNRAYGETTGRLQGGLAPAGPAPGAPPSVAPGGGYNSAPQSPKNAPASPAGGVSLTERTKETEGNAASRVAEFDTYRKENEGASVQKVALRQLMQDSERVRTGAGADKEQAARKWLMAAGQLIPGLQGVADKYSDPVAAFESISKNAGLISRTAIKSVGGTAASELDAISKSLVGTETSTGGIKINASQLVGLESYKQARFQAAQQYQDANGTLKGFSSDFNQKAGPAAWVYMSLPAEERAKIAGSLRKSKEGQHTLNSIAKQLDYIHKNKLDEGVD